MNGGKSVYNVDSAIAEMNTWMRAWRESVAALPASNTNTTDTKILCGYKLCPLAITAHL